MKKYAMPALVVIILAAIVYLIWKLMQERVSYLGRLDLPRGMRNNNPGNLVITNIPWNGKIPRSENTDGKFEQFFYYEDGIRAMILDMRGDIREGTDTIRKLVNEYAPDSENDVPAYIKDVSNWTGILPDALLSTDEATMQLLVTAFARKENGRADAITSTQFNTAWNLV